MASFPTRDYTSLASTSIRSIILPTTSYVNDSLWMEDSSPNYDDVKALFNLVMSISGCYLWIIFALGFPGNCAAIFTIFRMRSIGTFTNFVVLLALMDNLALSIKLLFHQLSTHHVDMGPTWCGVLRYLGTFTATYSCWILVVMALERFIAVRFPLKMNNGSNTRKIVIILVLIGVIIAIILLPLLWVNEMVLVENHARCEVKEYYAYFMTSIFYWISAAMYGFAPFVLLMIFNCLIAQQIKTSFKARVIMRNIQLLPSHTCCDIPVQRQVNLMLLSITVVFVVLTFPICMYRIADVHWHIADSFSERNGFKILCEQVAYVLCDSTHAVNFYLYFLTARRFRHHFLRLVTCKMCHCLKTLLKKGGKHSEPVDVMR